MSAVTTIFRPTAGLSPGARLACAWMTMFVVGTDLFIVSPLLPAIGQEFSRPAASTGLCVTAFSLAYLVSAPLLGRLADRAGRKRTLLACLAGFVLSNALTAIASGFGFLLLTRAAAGVTAAGVSPLIYAGVGEAAPPHRRATWMAIAVSGLLLALSVGAPAGTLIASRFGWRAPFLLIAALTLGLVLANAAAWPSDGSAAGRLGEEAPALDRRALGMRLLPTVLWATALYGFYTYLGAWLASAGLSPSRVASAVSFYGIGALIGTLTGGRMADRWGSSATMRTSLGGLAGCMAVFGSGIGTGWAADILLLALSLFAQLFFPAQQARLAREFPSHRAFALALNNSALFLGISAGSLLGGAVSAAFGFGGDAVAGALIAACALSLVARRAPWSGRPA